MGDDVMTMAQAAVAGVNVLKYPLVGFGLKRMIEDGLGRWQGRCLYSHNNTHVFALNLRV